MISIIICSRKNDISPTLKQNIQQTIGIDYEIIIIDNSQNKYSIFSAYNRGVLLSKFPILLFMHDDIEYRTSNWGHVALSYFEDPKVGSIGIAGTPYMPFNPGGWWSSGVGFLYLLQSEKDNPVPVLQNYFPEFSGTREVVALDGVWFCIRKELFEKIKFDDSSFDGFHFYDLDTTFQVYAGGYKLICIKNILIHHFSSGVLDQKWIKYLWVFHNKWKGKLPTSINRLSLKQQCHMEYRVLNTYIADYLRIFGDTKKNRSSIYKHALKQLVLFPRGRLYIKTPFWLMQFSIKYISNFLGKH